MPWSGRRAIEADHAWIELPIFDEAGRVRHRRGVTDIPGLMFVGLTLQHTRGSALIGWVTHDAEYIAERIRENQESDTRQSGETAVSQGSIRGPEARGEVAR